MSGPEQILEGLNDEQRQAVTTVAGPVAIIAGAGSGKTRVVSHRAAYAVAIGAVEERRILLVTFTDKAAREMAERVARLGLRRVTARTFHSAALAQLRYFWPLRHDGAALPELMADKWRIVAPLARALPGGYRFTPARDLMDEIEWAKSRRLIPSTYLAGSAGRTPPTTPEIFVRVFADYERTKQRRGLVDFDDILGLTVELLEDDEEAAAAVRSRYSWFTVDEFQDTTPLQARLLELWLGDRRDLCVVGDQDQTIYTFAGATPEHLSGFASRWADATVVPLLSNYRSSPQVLSFANKLLASGGSDKRLVATQPDGPEPVVRSFPSGDAEARWVVGRIQGLHDEGVPHREMAVLVRLNAQTVGFEEALARAGVPYRLRGRRFFERREVAAAMRALERLPDDAIGEALIEAALAVWAQQLGFDPDEDPDGREARERQASLNTLLSIVSTQALVGEGQTRGAVVEVLDARAAQEADEDADGVELLTLHRAKGLEWDAVFLPALEEGSLPVGQAKDDETAVAEERRLFYVGITRARRHLGLTWAQQRLSAKGKEQARTRSRFLAALGVGGPQRSSPPMRATRRSTSGVVTEQLYGDDAQLLERLKSWRLERAKTDGVPAYVPANDATLTAIAQRRPQNEQQLLGVPGIGPSKLEKYGQEILGIIGEE